MKHGDVLTFTVTDLSRSGSGVARGENGQIVFIPFTAPGDQVRARVSEVGKRYLHAELLEVLQPSSVRQNPRCPVFQKCGGCQWQHIPYELQWKTKLLGVLHALERTGIPIDFLIDEFPAKDPWEYRNRVQLRGFEEKMGFYSSGSHSLIPVDRCEIARSEINAVWEKTRVEGKVRKQPYKVELETLESGEVRKAWNASHGTLGFRQVNDSQNQNLRNWIQAHLTPHRILLDLFGGSGNLSLPLSKQMLEVHCVDVSPGPSENSLPMNFHFHRTQVLSWLLKHAKKTPAHSAILDPPREGLGSEFSEIETAFEKMGVSEVIAVGCDPDSWARDVSRFAKRGWSVARIGVLDFFPQTVHVESTAKMIRK